MDWSNYPSTHPICQNHPELSKKNHLVPGKFKDEGAGSPYIEGVFLRAKMYSILNKEETLNKSTAKGIDRRVKQKMLKHSAYVKTLDFPEETSKLSITKITHKDHQLQTVTQQKSSLSAFNDKVYITKREGKYVAHSYGYSPN